MMKYLKTYENYLSKDKQKELSVKWTKDIIESLTSYYGVSKNYKQLWILVKEIVDKAINSESFLSFDNFIGYHTKYFDENKIGNLKNKWWCKLSYLLGEDDEIKLNEFSIDFEKVISIFDKSIDDRQYENYQFLNEVKLTTDLTYYHGCVSTIFGEKILKDDFLKPGNKDKKRGHKLTPQIGRTYATPNLREAIIYTIGGNSLGGHCNIGGSGQYGYLFEIDKNSFTDVDPDEDYVGELIWIITMGKDYFKNYHQYDYFAKKIKDSIFNWDEYKRSEYLRICKNILTPIQYEKCIKYDDYADFAVAGKKLNKFLDRWWKEDIIKLGTPVANQGNLKFTKVWKFDKINVPKLKKDGSNFFELAELLNY